mgnify:FL=1
MFINSSSMSPDEITFLNRLTQKLFLCVFVSFGVLSFIELKADSPKYSAEIVNVNYGKDKIDFSVCLLRPFDWRLTPFVSKKTFPGNAPPWLPDPPRTRHRITWGTEGMFDWFQYDFIQLGNYQFTDEYTVRTDLWGGRIIIGKFNPKTNTLLYDGLEYVPFLPAPKFTVRVSENMKTWETIESEEIPIRDSDNGDCFRLSINRAIKKSEYITVNVNY